VTVDEAPAPIRPALAVRALREPKPERSPWQHQGVVVEEERHRDRARRTATVFLTGAECPFTCVFCDLWRYTLDTPTPAGALPAQLRAALEELRQRSAVVDQIKLYNASNFFEPRAVPEVDDEALLALLAPFARTTVECHPRLVLGARGRARWQAFAAGLHGSLEVAMGLETVHPRASSLLGKESDAAMFGAACDLLRGAGVGVRAFVLVGAPYVPAREQAAWTVTSAAAAAAAGAAVVSLVPVRGGNGALEELANRGEHAPVGLALVEEAYARALEEIEPAYPETAVLLDTWDLETLAAHGPEACAQCAAPRVERLRRMALGGRSEPACDCDCDCDRAGPGAAAASRGARGPAR
jgi:hypothetical protein